MVLDGAGDDRVAAVVDRVAVADGPVMADGVIDPVRDEGPLVVPIGPRVDGLGGDDARLGPPPRAAEPGRRPTRGRMAFMVSDLCW